MMKRYTKKYNIIYSQIVDSKSKLTINILHTSFDDTNQG